MTALRPATPEDAPAVAAVYLTSRRECLAFAPLAHGEEDVRQWITQVLIPSGGVTVAEAEDEIIGMMSVSRDAGIYWIDHLYLHPHWTGQGIGTAFVEYAKAELDRPIRLYTFQQNTGARRFYERHGFVVVAFGDGSDNEEHCPDILYEWNA